MKALTNIRYVVILLAGVFTLSCSSPEEETGPQPTNISINIFDDSENKITGITVYLYTNETDFEEAKLTGDFGDRIAQAIAEDGDSVSLTFFDINPERDHFVIATFRDRERFIDLDNFSGSYKIPKDILTINGTTIVNINLQPAKSAISFYSQTLSTSNFPISVYLGGDSIGVLNDNTATIPTSPFTTNAVSFRLSSSDSWYAISSLGCVWAGDISIGGTETFTAKELGSCNAGSINFWADSTLLDKLPIKITLDGIDEIGDINATSLMPSDCFSGDGLSVGRDPGTYTYSAVSLSSNCSWNGVVTIQQGVCEIVQLNSCSE